MKQRITLLYLLTAIMAVSGIADAAFINGGFEEGTLNGWTPNGGVAVIPSGGMSYFDVNSGDIFLDAPEGSKFVLLSTGPSSNGDIDIDGNGDLDFDIATLKQTFTLDANQVPAVISFKWSFLTSEVSFAEFRQDDFFQVKLTKNNNIGTAFLKGSVPGNGQSTSRTR